MNDNGSGGIRHLKRFTQRGPGAKRGREVGSDRVAGPGDVDRAANGQGRHMLHLILGRGAKNAPFGQRDEHVAPVFARQRGCHGFELDHIRVYRTASEGIQFSDVHLETDLRIIPQPAPAVSEDQQIRSAGNEIVDSLQHFRRDDTGFGHVHLIEQDERIDVREKMVDRADDPALKGARRGRPVLKVKAIQLERRFLRRGDEGLQVGECAPLFGCEEVPEANARHDFQRAAKLKPFGVVAGESDRVNRAHLEANQVVEDRARASRFAADIDDVVNRQAGLDRNLPFSRINLQIPVQAKVADHRDAEGGVLLGDRLETVRGHDFSSSWNRRCRNRTLSHWTYCIVPPMRE